MSTTAAASGRDPRVEQMIQNPSKYFAEARKAAREEADRAIERERGLRRRQVSGND